MRIVVRVLLALLAAFSSSLGSATLLVLRPPVARRPSWSCRFIGVVLREQGDQLTPIKSAEVCRFAPGVCTETVPILTGFPGHATHHMRSLSYERDLIGHAPD